MDGWFVLFLYFRTHDSTSLACGDSLFVNFDSPIKDINAMSSVSAVLLYRVDMEGLGDPNTASMREVVLLFLQSSRYNQSQNEVI